MVNSFSGREANDRRNYFMINLHESMQPGRFINIMKEIHAQIWLFADDTSLYLIVKHPDVTAQLLNIDLEPMPNGTSCAFHI